jgi:hypothetical protein
VGVSHLTPADQLALFPALQADGRLNPPTGEQSNGPAV